MGIGDRVKEIRKSDRVHLTMQAFGERLGVTQTAISKIESNDRGLTPAMTNAICREFNVSREWLLDGTGEMFEPEPTKEIDILAKRYNMTRNERILIEKVLELTPEQRLAVIDFIRKTAEALNEDIEAENDEIENSNDEIEKELADYRRQLELEKKVAEKSDHSHDSNAKIG